MFLSVGICVCLYYVDFPYGDVCGQLLCSYSPVFFFLAERERDQMYYIDMTKSIINIDPIQSEC